MCYYSDIGSENMNKIWIDTQLKSSDTTHRYQGMGLKKGNIITYDDNEFKTKITFDNDIILERKGPTTLKLCFKEKEGLGIYITEAGELETKTKITDISRDEQSFKIKYKLFINDLFIDNFEFIFKYTIDMKTNNR